MITIPKCFSALVASGQGQKCAELKQALHECLLERDTFTGLYKIEIFKNKKEYPEQSEIIAMELANYLNPIMSKVDRVFFNKDLDEKDTEKN